MKSKKIQTLVAAIVISCMTTTSGLPVFAAPNDTAATDTETTLSESNESTDTDVTSIDSSDNVSIGKIIQNIQDYDSKIEYKMEKLNELKEQILEKENQIEENEKQIETAEADIDEKTAH